MERHGGGEMMERAFLGFAALPAPGQENWWDILGLSPDCSLEEARRAYHASAIKYHPDISEDTGMMAKVNRAWDEARTAIKE